MPDPARGLRFNLRSTLATNLRPKTEETSSLLRTHVHGSANANIPCAVPATAATNLSRLNLKPAVKPLFSSMNVCATHSKYARLQTIDESDPQQQQQQQQQGRQPSLSNVWCRGPFWCILLTLGLVGALAYVSWRGGSQPRRQQQRPPPPPPPRTLPAGLRTITAKAKRAPNGKPAAIAPRRLPPPPPTPPPPASPPPSPPPSPPFAPPPAPPPAPPSPPALRESGSGVLRGDE